jgi:hypothetical protein
MASVPIELCTAHGATNHTGDSAHQPNPVTVQGSDRCRPYLPAPALGSSPQASTFRSAAVGIGLNRTLAETGPIGERPSCNPARYEAEQRDGLHRPL